MSLATSLLTLEQVQLLADCIEPALVLEVSPTAETLINLGLLVAAEIATDQIPCHVLAVTERGRTYVEAWVGRQERYHSETRTVTRRLIEFPAAPQS